MSYSVGWDADMDDIIRQFKDRRGEVEGNVTDALHELGEEWQFMAQTEHPWTNRTQDAERGLHYIVEAKGGNFGLDLAHGVYYGVYLELKHGGVWGVLRPTMMRMLPRVQQAIQRALWKR